VFAIAITLLVLDITVPASGFDHLWEAIGDQWPHYLGYITSFLTIGGLWLVHHGILRRMRYADPTVLRLNLLLLMVVAFLPFPTRLAADAITKTSAERPAVIVYGVTLFAISVILTALVSYVSDREDLVHEGIQREHVQAAAVRVRPGLGFYGAVLVLAIFAPRLAAFGFLAIALLALAPSRRPAGTRTDGPSSRAP
jgi:uncharacterized membrane protein